MKQFSIEGRTALVTGSGRGLGLSIARGLGEAGAALVINDVDASRADRAVAELQSAGLTARASIFDVTQRDAVRAAAEELEQSTGGIDILVNNAGIHCYGPLLDLEPAKWQAVLDVNLTGAFLVAQAFAAGMVRRQRGKVINICSLMSEAGRNTTGGYTAAKGGVKMLTNGRGTTSRPTALDPVTSSAR